MKKWNRLTSAAVLAACSGHAQTLPTEPPSAEDLYLSAKETPGIQVPKEEVTQDSLHKHQCELIEDKYYRCEVTIAYYLQTGDVLLDKQELLLSWQDGQWQRQ